ncbi:MAG: RNA polymerase sigma factor [Alkaliphilus sp.]
MQNTSWIDMEGEAKKDLSRLKEYKETRKNYEGLNEEVNKEIVSEIINCSVKYIKIIKNKRLHNYNSISVGDIQDPIYSLTDRQKEILLLRKDNTYREIAEKLNLDIRNVFESYQKAANRIIKIKHDELAILTKKQREIYDMREKAMKYQQIAEKLNISLNSVKSHIKEINKKIKRVRKLHDFS